MSYRLARRSYARAAAGRRPVSSNYIILKYGNPMGREIALEKQARHIRRHILTMLTTAKSSHLGSAFSIVEILTVLYHQLLDVEKIKAQTPDRDYVILSKGHAVSALYATLMSVNLIPEDLVYSYNKEGTGLGGHPVLGTYPGIEVSSGSLGHGLPMATGIALALKQDKKSNRVYAIVGDGECQEGSIWESVAFAARYRLNNLIIIVDHNNLQGLGRPDELMPGLLSEKFRAFGCATQEIDGHNFSQLHQALTGQQVAPSVIITHTIKGKGLSFAEDRLEWHYKSPNQEQLIQAYKELEEPCATSLSQN